MTDLTIDIFMPLTAAECAERDRLDAEMDQHEPGVRAYLQDLHDYREKHLWRGRYESFEHYVRTRRKPYTKSMKRLGQVLHFVDVLDSLKSQPLVEVLPDNERQTRELLKLKDPKEQAAAWLAAQVASKSDQPGSGWVKSSVETILQAKVTGGYIDTGNGRMTALSAGITQAESDRKERQRQHILDNQKRKKIASFEAVPQAIFNGNWLSMCIPPEVAAVLRVGQAVRFVVYPVTVKTNEVQA